MLPKPEVPDQTSIILHQFRFSSYCEKVRWALDYKGIDYSLKSYLPLLHMRPVRKLSGQTAVPVASFDGNVITGSAAILADLERRLPGPSLLPRDDAQRRALAWQIKVDDLGGALRAAMFYDFIDDPRFMRRMFSLGAGGAQRAIYRPLFRVGLPMLKKMLRDAQPDPEKLRDAAAAFLAEVAESAGSDRYLVDGEFTIADLAVASLLYPLFFPQGTPGSDLVSTSPAGRRWLARWRDHPARDYVIDMYARHRRQAPPVEC